MVLAARIYKAWPTYSLLDRHPWRRSLDTIVDDVWEDFPLYPIWCFLHLVYFVVGRWAFECVGQAFECLGAWWVSS